MHSIHSILSARLRQKRVALALASFYVLASGCARDRDPSMEPESDDMASDMETPSVDGTTATGSPEQTARGAQALDASSRAIDAARNRSSSDRAIADAAAVRSGDDGTAAAGASPTASADGVGTLQPAQRLDGGPAQAMQPQGGSIPAVSQPLDPAVAACATEMSSCVLEDPFQLDRCLERFSMCAPVFSGDAGQTAACATRFAVCILRDPLVFDPCLVALTSCPRQP